MVRGIGFAIGFVPNFKGVVDVSILVKEAEIAKDILCVVFRFVATRSAEFALSFTLRGQIGDYPRGDDRAEHLTRLEVGQQFQLVEALVRATHSLDDEAFLALLRTSKIDALDLASEDAESWLRREENTLGEMLLTILRNLESFLSWDAGLRKSEISGKISEGESHALEQAHCDILLSQIGFLRLAITFIEEDILGK